MANARDANQLTPTLPLHLFSNDPQSFGLAQASTAPLHGLLRWRRPAAQGKNLRRAGICRRLQTRQTRLEPHQQQRTQSLWPTMRTIPQGRTRLSRLTGYLTTMSVMHATAHRSQNAGQHRRGATPCSMSSQLSSRRH